MCPLPSQRGEGQGGGRSLYPARSSNPDADNIPPRLDNAFGALRDDLRVEIEAQPRTGRHVQNAVPHLERIPHDRIAVEVRVVLVKGSVLDRAVQVGVCKAPVGAERRYLQIDAKRLGKLGNLDVVGDATTRQPLLARTMSADRSASTCAVL